MEIDDDGRGHPVHNGAGSGKGIVGMRERAAALGGELQAAPSRVGGSGCGLAFAIRSGVSGFLVKDTDPAELVQAVRVVAAGEALLSPSVTRRLIEEFAARTKQPQPAGDLQRLTEREREVVALVGEGLSNPEIAERLVISPVTAKTHVSRAMRELGAHDRAQLVVLAYESGLVRPGWLG